MHVEGLPFPEGLNSQPLVAFSPMKWGLKYYSPHRVIFSMNKTVYRAWLMAQWVEHLSCRCENLTLNPCNPCKAESSSKYLYSQCSWVKVKDGDRGIPAASRSSQPGRHSDEWKRCPVSRWKIRTGIWACLRTFTQCQFSLSLTSCLPIPYTHKKQCM